MTDDEYHVALERINELAKLDPAIDTPEGNELEELVGTVITYERAHFPEMFAKEIRS
jgi:antitoxin component HigA of HigAB toxin-antitoxin module